MSVLTQARWGVFRAPRLGQSSGEVNPNQSGTHWPENNEAIFHQIKKHLHDSWWRERNGAACSLKDRRHFKACEINQWRQSLASRESHRCQSCYCDGKLLIISIYQIVGKWGQRASKPIERHRRKWLCMSPYCSNANCAQNDKRNQIPFQWKIK